LRVAGSNVITGPTIAGSVDTGLGAAIYPAVAFGIILPTGAQAVEVHAAFSGSGTLAVDEGRLQLIKIA
jgi:hypothetical protein